MCYHMPTLHEIVVIPALMGGIIGLGLGVTLNLLTVKKRK